jgi:hypothetical protein
LCDDVSPRLFAQAAAGGFHIEEASITDIQSAIREGRPPAGRWYRLIRRAKAYNGVCTALVTMDGKPIPPSTGMVRAGAPIAYPTKTVAASTVFPSLDHQRTPSTSAK